LLTKKLALRILAVAFSVVIGIALFEALVAAGVFGFLVADQRLARVAPEVVEEASYWWEHDPLLGWRNIPARSGFYALGDRPRVEINSRGLRDDEYAYQGERGVLRILAIGDSRTVGFEVASEFLFDRVLEQQFGGVRVEVINAGVRGYGTDQAFLYLTKEGFRYAPDAVLYLFSGNDLRNNIVVHKPYRKFGKPYFAMVDGELVLEGVPVPETFDPDDAWLTSSPAAQDHYNKELEWRRYLKRAERRAKRPPDLLPGVQGALRNAVRPRIPAEVELHQWEITEAILEQMATFCRARDIQLHTMIALCGVEEMQDHERRLAEVAEKYGYSHIRSVAAFTSEANGTRMYCFSEDLHWNRKGHARAATIIKEHFDRHPFVSASQ
jgi:hypothetical protein